MKTKDKVVDDILKGLADYKPPAKPDWDSFYTGYLQNISETATRTGTSKAGRLAMSTGFRTAVIAILAISGMVAAWFFIIDSSKSVSLQDDQNTHIQVQPEQNSSNPSIIIEPGTPNNQQGDNVVNSSGSPATLIFDNAGTKANPGNSSGASETTMPVINMPPVDKRGESQTNGNESTLITDDSLSDQPVIVKKTVIISDTLRVKQPHKK